MPDPGPMLPEGFFPALGHWIVLSKLVKVLQHRCLPVSPIHLCSPRQAGGKHSDLTLEVLSGTKIHLSSA